MSNIIPFESAKLPAYIKAANLALNDDLTAHAGQGFPVMSIKGKTWAIVRDGERTIVPNPKDPDSPASFVEVVIVKANPNTSKIWYLKGYVEGAEATKPDCFSSDGRVPDAGSTLPQSKNCAICPHNQWGSRITPDGKKGKSCQDSVRMAIAAPDSIDDPMLLRVPPASIREIGAYGSMLKKKGVDYTMVVTRISFDQEQATPKLVLKPVGFLDEQQYAQVVQVRGEDVVQQIIGSVGIPIPEGAEPTPVPDRVVVQPDAVAQDEAFEQAAVSKEKTVTEEEVAAVLAKASKPRATTKPKAEPVAEPVAATADALGDIDLDNLSFDD